MNTTSETDVEALAPVRIATEDDLAIASALVAPTPIPETGYTYVLPYAAGGIAAVAHLEIEGARGRLELLVIGEDAYTPIAERRLVGIAGALAFGHGCKQLDVAVRALGRARVLH